MERDNEDWDLPVVVGDWSDPIWDEPTVEIPVSTELLIRSRFSDDLPKLFRVISDLMGRAPSRALFILEEAFFGESDYETNRVLQALYAAIETVMRDRGLNTPTHSVLAEASTSITGLPPETQKIAEECLTIAARRPELLLDSEL